MDALTVILAVEQGELPEGMDEFDLLRGIEEHKEALRKLQGSWGRLIAQLEETGEIE